MSQGSRQKFARTFRKSSCKRGAFWGGGVFRDFGWAFGPLHTPPCSSEERLFCRKRHREQRAKNLVVDVVSLVLEGALYLPAAWKVLPEACKDL